MEQKEREQKKTDKKGILDALFGASGGLPKEAAESLLRALPDWQEREPYLYRDIRRFYDGISRTEEAGRRIVIGAEHAGYRDHRGKPLCQWEPGILALTGHADGKDQIHIYIPAAKAEKEAGTDGQ